RSTAARVQSLRVSLNSLGPALRRAEGLHPHGAVKWRGDKEGPFSLGLRHGSAPLLHGVRSECRQDVCLQRLHTGPLIKGGELGDPLHLAPPGLPYPPAAASIITPQLAAPITRPARP